MRPTAGELSLQAQHGTERRATSFYEKQMLDHLNPAMQEFVGRMEMVFIASAGADGDADCSFRAGPPGFVRVIDSTTLAYPEYRGNGVMASLGNMLENAHIGMLFIDFYESTVGLHVNGGARIAEIEDMQASPTLRAALDDDVSRVHPERWVIVDVHEAYIHCSKHVPLLAKLDKAIVWGTDDAVRKGGDHFNVAGRLMTTAATTGAR
jgi:predicted pyridoxine 5'-phosphate oxidase superfamily flavin-nucleotide-binding protein